MTSACCIAAASPSAEVHDRLSDIMFKTEGNMETAFTASSQPCSSIADIHACPCSPLFDCSQSYASVI
jgi:hypothetical protein